MHVLYYLTYILCPFLGTTAAILVRHERHSPLVRSAREPRGAGPAVGPDLGDRRALRRIAHRALTVIASFAEHRSPLPVPAGGISRSRIRPRAGHGACDVPSARQYNRMSVGRIPALLNAWASPRMPIIPMNHSASPMACLNLAGATRYSAGSFRPERRG